jgi:hypothetical protein
MSHALDRLLLDSLLGFFMFVDAMLIALFDDVMKLAEELWNRIF